MLCIIPDVPQQESDVPGLGAEEKVVQVNPTDDPAELGPQDHIFVALKAHSIPSVVDAMQPLISNRTSVVIAINGVPYWYFHQHGGELAGTRLEMVDPGGKQWSGLGPERAIGCVAYPATEVEPGVIQHNYGDKFPLSEPFGEKAWFKTGWLLSDSGVLGRGHAIKAAIREPSRALPRRRSLCTNWRGSKWAVYGLHQKWPEPRQPRDSKFRV